MTDSHWIGYAVVAIIIMVGNAVFQWWKGVQIQKHGQQLDDFKIVIEQYKDLLKQRDDDIKEIKNELFQLSKDHASCIATQDVFKIRLETSEKTVLQLQTKLEQITLINCSNFKALEGSTK